MPSTRIRTIVALLAAALIVAVVTGPIAPAAQASKNTGGFQRSSEALRLSAQTCDYVYGQFENAVNKAEAAYKAGDLKGMNSWLDEARTDLNTATQGGCD
jgi:hypothetical protein